MAVFNLVQRRVQQRLDTLNFDFQTYTSEGLIVHLEQQRGRRIRFIPLDFPPDLFGGWVTSKDYPLEYIFLNDQLPPLQREHTLLHELGHIILGHQTLAVDQADLEAWRRRGHMPNFLCRAQADQPSQEELEAETLAVQLQALIHQYAPDPTTSSLAAGRTYLDRVWGWR